MAVHRVQATVKKFWVTNKTRIYFKWYTYFEYTYLSVFMGHSVDRQCQVQAVLPGIGVNLETIILIIIISSFSIMFVD